MISVAVVALWRLPILPRPFAPPYCPSWDLAGRFGLRVVWGSRGSVFLQSGDGRGYEEPFAEGVHERVQGAPARTVPGPDRLQAEGLQVLDRAFSNTSRYANITVVPGS